MKSAQTGQVISIIDANSSVGAVIARTRDIAVVESDVELQNQGLCKMTYIGKNVSIMSGDIAETSDWAIYPKGILIGRYGKCPETAGIYNMPYLSRLSTLKEYQPFL